VKKRTRNATIPGGGGGVGVKNGGEKTSKSTAFPSMGKRSGAMKKWGNTIESRQGKGGWRR